MLNVTPITKDGNYYLLGAKLNGIHPSIDFPSKKKGFHLSYVSDRFAPVTVFFKDGETTYSLLASEAIQAPALLEKLSGDDQQSIISLSQVTPSKPDYSKCNSMKFRPE